MVSDTSPELQKWLLEKQRAMTTAQRVEQTFNLIALVQGIEEAVLKHRYPTASPLRLKYLLAKKRFGAEIAEQMFGRVEA